MKNPLDFVNRSSVFILPVYFYRPQRSWAKVIFSQACVKNSVHGGGVSVSVHAGIPPRTRHPPRDQAHPPGPGTPPEQTPPGPGTPPPETRHTPRADTPRDQAHPPGDQAHPPPGKQTAAYGQRAAGTHPTGMHSC